MLRQPPPLRVSCTLHRPCVLPPVRFASFRVHVASALRPFVPRPLPHHSGRPSSTSSPSGRMACDVLVRTRRLVRTCFGHTRVARLGWRVPFRKGNLFGFEPERPPVCSERGKGDPTSTGIFPLAIRGEKMLPPLEQRAGGITWGCHPPRRWRESKAHVTEGHLSGRTKRGCEPRT